MTMHVNIAWTIQETLDAICDKIVYHGQPCYLVANETLLRNEFSTLIDYNVKEYCVIKIIETNFLDHRAMNCNTNAIFRRACFVGNMQLVQLLIHKGIEDWDLGTLCAAQNGHFQILDLILDKCSKGIIQLAIRYSTNEVAKYILQSI